MLLILKRIQVEKINKLCNGHYYLNIKQIFLTRMELFYMYRDFVLHYFDYMPLYSDVSLLDIYVKM